MYVELGITMYACELQPTQLTSTIGFLNCSLRYDKLEDYEQSADW